MTHALTTRISFLVAAVVASLASLGFAPAAQGQEAALLTQRCVNAMQNTGYVTRNAVRAAGTRGVAAIAVLDRNGASDDELTAAAQQARDAVAGIADRGTTRINRIADHCLAALADLNADPAFADRVTATQSNQNDSIQAADANAVDRINRALDIALNN